MKFGEYTQSMNPVYADISIEEVIAKHNGLSFGEIKEDGYRCQVHADGDDVKMFTRAGNEYIYECYPEIVKAVQKLNLRQTVLDAEIKGEDIGYKGFTQIRKRFRRTPMNKKKLEEYKELIKKYPLKLVVFDTLMFEGGELLNTELEHRREYTENVHGKKIEPSILYRVTSEKQFNELFEEKVKKQRHEGFVLKNPGSFYIGKPKELYQKDEKYNWVKIKNFETLDLVVVGLLKTDSKYSKNFKFSSALCAMKNNETGLYEALGTVSLARKNPITNNPFGADLEKMILNFSAEKPANVYLPERIEKKLSNVTFVKPEDSQVIAVKTMNLEFDSSFYTFRIAYINDIREDKNVSQATILKEIQELYKLQEAKK